MKNITYNHFLKQLAGVFKKAFAKKGFSLIELLVVIAIIGVLAAVAIPAYQNYQDNAAQNSLTTSLKNIGKAHLACRVNANLGGCDTLSDINVACDSCGMISTSSSYPWCVDAEISDNNACLIITGNTAPPVIINDWESPDCTKLYSNFSCSSGNWTAGATVCNGVTGCTSPSAPTMTGSTCATTTQWIACTGSTTNMAMGECTTSTGQCT